VTASGSAAFILRIYHVSLLSQISLCPHDVFGIGKAADGVPMNYGKPALHNLQEISGDNDGQLGQ
jgi:hypothetical protein